MSFLHRSLELNHYTGGSHGSMTTFAAIKGNVGKQSANGKKYLGEFTHQPTLYDKGGNKILFLRSNKRSLMKICVTPGFYLKPLTTWLTQLLLASQLDPLLTVNLFLKSYFNEKGGSLGIKPTNFNLDRLQIVQNSTARILTNKKV